MGKGYECTTHISQLLRCQLLIHFYRHKRNSGKVMFLQASVCPWGGGGSKSHDMGPGYPTRPPTWDLLLTSSGHHWRPVQTCLLEDLPPIPHQIGTDNLVVTTEAGGTHPTGMLSCAE